MPDHLLIYAIVILNALCQTMLIWRLRLARGSRITFQVFSLATPVLISLAMRLAVACGALHERVAEQTGSERFITALASILLIAGPWIVTICAVIAKRAQKIHAYVGNVS